MTDEIHHREGEPLHDSQRRMLAEMCAVAQPDAFLGIACKAGFLAVQWVDEEGDIIETHFTASNIGVVGALPKQ